MNIKLLALDLDDTLLKEDLTISERNIRALRAAEERGVTIILASGRIPHAMASYVEALGMNRKPGYLIANNGATIMRTDTGEVTAAHLIDERVCAEAHEFLKARRLPLHVYGQDTLYASRDNEWADMDCRLSNLKKIVVADIERLYAGGASKLVAPGDPQFLRGLLAEMQRRFSGRANVLISKPYFLEVLPVDADKGLALRELAVILGVPRDQVMAMGDAMNDLGMIRFAGWGVAMANAMPEIKAAARLVTECSHEEDGVAEMIERFIL